MPEKTDVLLGGTKRFECRVIGYPRPEIKWYKDGVEITSNKRYNFTFTREGVISMLIQQVSRQDEGCYRCRASNSEGMASTAAYLFVRTKKSKFLEDTPLVHSMSFGEATDKDLELDKEFKTKQIEKRKEEETMETEEYEHKITMETEEFDHRITMEEQSDILKGREVSDDVIGGSMDQRAVTLTEITSESESSFSSVEHMKGSKKTQDELEKVAKMYGDVMDSEKNISIEIESQSKIKSKEESLTVESEVSIEEKKSKTIEISSEESKSVTKEVSMTSSVTKESTEEKSKLEDEIKKKEEQLSDLLTQESTEESEIKENQLKEETKSRLDISVELEETKTLTQTADDSGLGLSFTANMDEKSFEEQNNSLITISSSEIAGETTSVKTELHESSEISAEVKTETNEAEKDQDMNITAETSIEESFQKDDLSFDATVTTDSSEIKSLEVSTEVKTEESASLKLEAKQVEELLEKKLEETESLHGETVPEKLSERVSTPQDLILPKIGVAEYKAEELGEQQSVSSVEDLSSEQLTAPKTSADDYYGEEDLVLPIVRQAPVYKTEEIKDQLSEGSFEDLSFDETSQSEPDVKVENEPLASAKAFVESQADILEGPSEPEVSQIPESKAETATSSLGPDSGVFSMSLQDEFQVAAVGSSVDSVDHLSSAEAAKATEGDAEKAERMPTFVNFEQRVNEREVEKTVESTETLHETETTFVSKTEEEKSEAKKSQDAFMADGVSEETVSTDVVQSINASDFESAAANIKVEEENQQQLIREPSIEALVEQASLDDIAALADLQTIEGEDKSVRGESLADADIVQMAEKEQAVESNSNVADISQSEDSTSEISEVPEAAEVRENKQQQEMGSERAELMPGEIILEADANVDNTEVKPENLLADAKVDVEETRGDDTLVLRADVAVSEEKYAQEEDGLRMSASVDTEQVVFTPKVTRVPEDISVQPGETIQLVSEVQGSPAPEVKWFKEGDTVKPTERISLLADNDIYTLEIREATGSDAGTYTLTAHNSEGTIFSDVQVTVNVPQDEGAVGGATGGGDVSVTATLSAPEFVIMPEDTSVQEFEQLQLFCSVKGTPTPEVKWQREGQTLQADSHMRIFESDGCHFLEIPQASFLDSGEYECIATNSEGTVSVVIRLTVEGVTDIDESGLSTNEDLRVAMSERSDTDDNFLRICVVTSEHVDESTNISLNEGEVVEVLNSTMQTGNWLVRKTTDKEQVAYIPSSSLKGQEIQLRSQDEMTNGHARRREHRLSRSPSQRSNEMEPGDTSDDEGHFSLREHAFSLKSTRSSKTSTGFPVYVVIADYTPGEGERDSLRLGEGQYVEVLDMQRPDRWLVKTKPTKTNPAKEGWVPSAYLNQKMLGTTVTKRSTTEQFREEIIQISNKQQESLLKRRYAVTELLETEREYIRHLNHLIKEYKLRLADSDVPDVLRNKKDLIFCNVEQILNFHQDEFLAALSTCTAVPQNVGQVFLEKRAEFMQYVEYLCQRETAEFFLDTEEARTFLKDYSSSIKDGDTALKSYLMKPMERLAAYRMFLQDYLRYTARAGKECSDAEAAIAMLHEITNQVDQIQTLGLIEGYAGDIHQAGTLLRHDDFLLWDVANPNTTRGKERHLFLFGDKLLLTKRKKPDTPTDTATFVFKSLVELQNVQINETVTEDDRRFELWYAEPTSEKLTFQAKNIYAKQAWVKEIRETLHKHGIQETDIMPDRRRGDTSHYSKQSNGDEVDRGNDSGSESDRTQDYMSLSSFESDLSSYHTAHEFDDGTSRPYFRRRPKKVVCTEGSTAKLDCIVGGNPLPTVTWLLNNTEVEETINRKSVVEGDNCALVFREVKKTEGGQYTAKATNINGSIVSTAELVVLEGIQDQGGSEPASGAVSPEPTEKVESVVEKTPEASKEPTPEPVKEPETEPTPGALKEQTPELVKEPTPEPIKESASEPVKEPTPEPVKEPTQELVKEQTPEPIKEPTKEPVKEPTPEQVKEPTTEPAKEPTPEPVKEPGPPEPVKEPTPETSKEPKQTKEPTPEPVKEPTPEPVKEPTPEPVKEPTPEPVKEPTPEQVKEPTPEPQAVKQPEPEKEPTPEQVKDLIPEPVKEPQPVEKEPTPEPIKEPEPVKKEPTPEPIKEPEPVKKEPTPEPIKEPEPVKKEPTPEPIKEPEPVKKEPTPEPIKEPEPVKKEPTPEPIKEPEPVKKEPTPEPIKESEPVQKEPTPEPIKEPESIKKEPTPEPIKEPEPIKKEPTPEPIKEPEPIKKEPSPEPIKEPEPLKEPTPLNELDTLEKQHCEQRTKAPEEESLQKKTEALEETDSKTKEPSPVTVHPEEKKEESPKGSAPYFLEEMKNLQLELGQIARFDCRVCAYPDPEISWRKDGKVLKESEKFKLLNTNNDIFSLLIKNVKVADSGRYQCVARNEFGEAVTEALLNVTALKPREDEDVMAPRFTTKFYDIDTLEGVPVDFSCIFEGKPEPDVAWLINGEKFTKELNFDADMKSDGKQASLSLKMAQTYHTGEITCRLRNIAGEAKCRAWLTVKEDPKKRGTRPEFEERPRDTDIRECEDATFEAVVSGDPAPQVTWYFKGRELFESKRRDIRHVGDTHTLVLKDIAPSNEGEYTCRAKNSAGEVSCQAWLTVLAPKKREPSPPIFKEVPMEKTKPYAFPPSFTRRIVDTIAPPGGSARFECRTIGVPEPSVEWKKDGEPIKPGGKFTVGKDGDTHYLVVDNADKEDMGEFTCTIANDAGKATSLARLRVKEESDMRPYSPARVILPEYSSPYAVKDLSSDDNIPSMPFDKPALLDVKPDSVKLTWLPAHLSDLSPSAGPVTYIIEARELPGMRWSRIASDVPSTQYVVRNLSPDKEYNFRIRAENKFGNSEPTLPAVLDKRKVPKKKEHFEADEYIAAPYLPSTKPYITDMGTETLRLAWEPARVPSDRFDLPPVSYRLEAQELPREDWVPLASKIFDPNAYLTDLAPDRDYNIRVRAENKYGISEPSDSIWLPRARAFPGVPISRPQIVEIEPDSVRLNWRRVDIPTFESEDSPLRYMIEMNEPPSSQWTQIAGRIPDTTYVIQNLVPGHDYRFRVRAESPDGLPGEPSPATSLYRTLALSRVPVDALEIEDYEPDYEAVRLSWRRVEVPPYATDEDHLTYMIEGSEPGVDDWRPLATGIPGTSYRLSDIGPTQDYRFRVRGLTPYGITPPSYPASMSRTLAPIRPVSDGLKMSDIQPDSLRLSWLPLSLPDDEYKSAESIRYQIEAQELPSTSWQAVARDIPGTSYNVSGLKPGHDYSFRVRPMGLYSDLDPYPTVHLTSFPVKPRLPIRQPIMSELGSDSVRLSWRPAEMPMYTRRPIPVSYTVEMQEVPTSTWLTVARRIPDTSHVVNGLRPDKEYTFRIRPETEYGPGESSIPIKLYRKPVLTLPSREPRISDVTADSALLSWLPIDIPKGSSFGGPVTYRVEAKEPTGGNWMPIATHIPTTQYNARFLNPDRDYVFRVIADADGVFSEPSSSAYLPHRASPPRMPREMPYAFNIQPDSLTLQWRCVELPSRLTDYSPVTYRIEMIDTPGGDWKTHSRDIPKTQTHLIGLLPDRDYTFRVRAENDFGIGEPTEPVVVKKRAVAPSLPKDEPFMSDMRPGSLRLSWRPAEMPSYVRDQIPTTYTIMFQEFPDTNWRPLVRRIPDHTYHVYGLNPEKDYCFRVQAENEYGMSSPTMPVRLPRYQDIRGPIEIPEFEDYEPSNLRLTWKRPQVAPYEHRPVTYTIETWKPKERTWQPYVSKLPEPRYKLTDIDRYRDHMFRIRAETEAGLSEPSIPVSYSPRRVMPTVPVEKPEIYDIHGDSVRVSWRPVYLPSFVPIDLRYRLEIRELPAPHWRTLVPNTSDLSYQVTGLRSRQDYAFRVRAITDDGPSEPSYPVYLYRKPAIPYTPFSTPEIEDVEDTSAKLRWHLVDVPPFENEDEPLSFMIESQRFPDYEWRPVARGVRGSSYRVTGLQPKQDYYFRLRGETPYGLTEPSKPTTLYRRPVLSGVPIARPSVSHEEPYGARLRWSNVYIPSHRTSPSLSYIIEMQEPPRLDWTPIARDITSHEYQVTDLSPRKDYMFRIRASDPTGDVSRPTPPIPYYKSTRLSYEPLKAPETLFTHEDFSVPNRPYIDSLTVKVPPRLTIEKPTMYESSPDSVQLTWHAARVPSQTATLSRTTYRVEMRPQDCFDWREAASGIVGTTFNVKDLHPFLDYAFRVRAVNDFGYSEPTLPVFLNRPLDQQPGYSDEDEDYDYGLSISETVAPKLPIDTPRLITTSPESARLSWNPARIPVYAKSTPITYAIEGREAPSGPWRDLKTGISEVFYEVKNLVPTQDYHFRIRAENEYGASEPTFHAVLTRARPIEKRRASLGGEDRPTSPKTPSYVDTLLSGVPPRTPAGRPAIGNQTEDRLTLTWQPARMPSYLRSTKVSYIVEQREPPNHLWSVIAEDVPETTFKVHGLDPEQDYMFRVRGQNEFGTSDPTLPSSLTRDREDPNAYEYRGRSSSRARSPSVSPSPHLGSGPHRMSLGGDDEYFEGIPVAPDFILPKDNVQYATEGGTAKIALQLRGNPLPVVVWYFNGEKIIYGDRYNPIITPNGQVVLEFTDMSLPDIGEYKCEAENDHGVATRTISLKLADPPTIIQPMVDITLVERNSGKLTVRVDGFPTPSIKWSKDWRPLSETSRIFVNKDTPDTWTLHINNAMSIDEGQYMVTAENVGGKVQCSARVTIEDTMPPKRIINFKESPNVEDNFYILEEQGRGRHGIVNRVIEKATGDVYAAKFVRLRDDTEKDFFRPEMETMRAAEGKHLPVLYDAYETPKQLIFITDLLTGGPLLDRITRSGNLTENGAAVYIRQLLEALKPLHQQNIAHLDIKPSNIMFTSPSSEDIKLVDFGFAKKIPFTKDVLFNFGTPEWAAPEQIDHEPISVATDMWSLGALTYLLLSGISPFRDDTIRDTLIKSADCDWTFDEAAFSKISPEAKDFISKLLVLQPDERLTVDECMEHPWMKKASDKSGGAQIDVAKLKAYSAVQNREHPVRTVAHLHSLTKLMEGTPLDGGLHPEADPKTGKICFPGSEAYGEFLDEESWYDWQQRNQSGQETDLFPSRDTDYSLRIRGYRRQATAEESFDLDDDVYGDDDFSARAQTIRERRLLSDVDKETLPPSLEKEMAWIAEMREKRPKEFDEMSVASKRSSLGSVSTEGMPGPSFKAKLEDMAVGVGETVTLCCHMMGPPMPTAAWYHDEELITEGSRVKTGICSDGRAYLSISNIKPYDAGTYKCVARNKYGRMSCRCRLLIGECPDRPGRPVATQVSSSEALVIWDTPKSDGGCEILYYRVDYKTPGSDKWTTGVKTTTECAVVSGLKPDKSYWFRVCAVNEFGPSSFSWGSAPVSTKPAGAPALTSDPEFDLAVLRSRQQQAPEPPASHWEVPEIDEGDSEVEPELKKKKPEDVYNLGDVLWKGKFSSLQKVINPSGEQEQELVMRVVPLTKDNESDRLREFNILKSINHNHIGRLVAGFQTDKTLFLVLERMSGDNIARHLAFRCRYSEDAVAYVLRQVIDALQFLHRHGYAHLNLQPGSLLMHNRQSLNVKLVDFSLARKISPDGDVVPRHGYPDFMPPEVVTGEKVSFSADVWGVGVLAFLLLSGQSCFHGDTDAETLANVAYNRYNANDMYENVTKEGLKFVYKVLKRVPRNRPSLAELLEMKWMQQTDVMIKARRENWFLTNNIRKFADEYDRHRQADNFKEDYLKVELTVKKPIESKRVRKEKKPVDESSQPAEKSETEDKEKMAAKAESEAPKSESEATGGQIEQVADDVVSKAMDDAMQSSELGSA